MLARTLRLHPQIFTISAQRSFIASARTMSPTLNTAGMKPEETKALKERSPKPHEEPIIKSLKEVYIVSD